MKHFQSRERGQSLLEFAIIFVILILMLAGITEIGFLYVTMHTVQNASREGARIAVTMDDLAANDPRVLGRVEALIPATDFYAGFHGSTTVNAVSDCNVNDEVTVVVTGDYDFVVMDLVGLTTLDLSFPTTMRYERCE